MRTFIAIELPKEILDLLAKIQSGLKASGADVKWVEPKNIHLTLKFLGELNDEKLEKAVRGLEDTAGENNPFRMRIASAGAFPRIEYPRVIWLGIDKGDKEAKKISDELEERLQKSGIPREERPFSAHITLGRTRSALGREKLISGLKTAAAALAKENSGSLEFPVTKLVLFKSELSPKGPVYDALKEANLKTI